MLESFPDILARIVAGKREELARGVLAPSGARPAPARDFRAALAARRPAIIAEIKKASPSKGLLAPDFDPARQATLYAQGGAAALSVLTDEPFFQGSLADLAAARAAAPLPVLRKDFTIDRRHVEQAAAAGADAILLIAAILETRELRDFRELAARHKMAALVEVHDAAELARALDSGAEIIGVNNRNLRTFEVSLETSLGLAEQMPEGVLRVSESGIHGAADVRRLMDAGYHAFLVGEHLMRSPDPAAALAALGAA
ncbi:MAG: indole-3-glycerol phosphate synthase TrpC [Bryobacteraceae bacterium]